MASILHELHGIEEYYFSLYLNYNFINYHFYIIFYLYINYYYFNMILFFIKSICQNTLKKVGFDTCSFIFYLNSFDNSSL